jgi:hypothetical protein
MKLMGRLGWLAQGIAVADFAPTTQQVEVQQLLHRQVQEARARLDALLQKEFPAFNTKLRERGVLNIIAARH